MFRPLQAGYGNKRQMTVPELLGWLLHSKVLFRGPQQQKYQGIMYVNYITTEY
jgi:hypothetical protein